MTHPCVWQIDLFMCVAWPVRSMLQHIAACCSMLQHVVACCSMLQQDAGVLQRMTHLRVRHSSFHSHGSMYVIATVCCSRFSALQRVAATMTPLISSSPRSSATRLQCVAIRAVCCSDIPYAHLLQSQLRLQSVELRCSICKLQLQHCLLCRNSGYKDTPCPPAARKGHALNTARQPCVVEGQGKGGGEPRMHERSRQERQRETEREDAIYAIHIKSSQLTIPKP